MHFPVRSDEDLARAHQLLRKPWMYPSICLIGLLCLWEFVKWVPIVAGEALGLLLVTIFGVSPLMPLTIIFSVWEEVALQYDDSFAKAVVGYRKKARRGGRLMSQLGIKALTCFLQRWGNLVVQQLALLLITYYTSPPKAFYAYLCLLVFGFVLQWLGETELDITKAWCLCFATLFKLYHLVYLSNLWGMGFKGCHPITRVAFMTTSYYMKPADDDFFSPICDDFAKPNVQNAPEGTKMEIKLHCPVPYPLNLIFSSSSKVKLNWILEGGGLGTLEVKHKFLTTLFRKKIASIEKDDSFRLLCCEFGRARVFKFMMGVESARAVLMERIDDISHCYSLRETITFVANPDNDLIKADLDEEIWCC